MGIENADVRVQAAQHFERIKLDPRSPRKQEEEDQENTVNLNRNASDECLDARGSRGSEGLGELRGERLLTSRCTFLRPSEIAAGSF